MNEAKIEEAGTEPLAPMLARLDAVKDKSDVTALLASFSVLRVDAPFSPVVHQDNRDSSKYLVDLRLRDARLFVSSKTAIRGRCSRSDRTALHVPFSSETWRPAHDGAISWRN